jgi:hypothetical protein
VGAVRREPLRSLICWALAVDRLVVEQDVFPVKQGNPVQEREMSEHRAATGQRAI